MQDFVQNILCGVDGVFFPWFAIVGAQNNDFAFFTSKGGKMWHFQYYRSEKRANYSLRSEEMWKIYPIGLPNIYLPICWQKDIQICNGIFKKCIFTPKTEHQQDPAPKRDLLMLHLPLEEEDVVSVEVEHICM